MKKQKLELRISQVVNVPAGGSTGDPVKKTLTCPVFLSEEELALTLQSLLLAEVVHLSEAQKALEAQTLDKCCRHLQASEAAHVLAERISGMSDLRRPIWQ
jgi:hypothetical protein